MSGPTDSTSAELTQAAELFRTGLQEVWSSRRAQEEEIARTYAPLSAKVTALLGSIASSVSEITGEEARVDELQSSFHVSSRSLVTCYTIRHSSSDFHVRVLYGHDGMEYQKRRLGLAETEELFRRIVGDALTHFGPKAT